MEQGTESFSQHPAKCLDCPTSRNLNENTPRFLKRPQDHSNAPYSVPPPGPVPVSYSAAPRSPQQVEFIGSDGATACEQG